MIKTGYLFNPKASLSIINGNDRYPVNIVYFNGIFVIFDIPYDNTAVYDIGLIWLHRERQFILKITVI